MGKIQKRRLGYFFCVIFALMLAALILHGGRLYLPMVYEASEGKLFQVDSYLEVRGECVSRDVRELGALKFWSSSYLALEQFVSSMKAGEGDGQPNTHGEQGRSDLRLIRSQFESIGRVVVRCRVAREDQTYFLVELKRKGRMYPSLFRFEEKNGEFKFSPFVGEFDTTEAMLSKIGDSMALPDISYEPRYSHPLLMLVSGHERFFSDSERKKPRSAFLPFWVDGPHDTEIAFNVKDQMSYLVDSIRSGNLGQAKKYLSDVDFIYLKAMLGSEVDFSTWTQQLASAQVIFSLDLNSILIFYVKEQYLHEIYPLFYVRQGKGYVLDHNFSSNVLTNFYRDEEVLNLLMAKRSEGEN